jgi:hypothetical protein
VIAERIVDPGGTSIVVVMIRGWFGAGPAPSLTGAWYITGCTP